MKNLYTELKNKHQEDYNNFPIGFAFSQSQFDEAMKGLGLEPSDTKKVVSIGGGGFIRKTDIQTFNEMIERHEQERQKARENETFIYQMFVYELDNHEYNYTWELEPTLDALMLTREEVEQNELLKQGLKKALHTVRNRQEV